jgi:hypothetical protein
MFLPIYETTLHHCHGVALSMERIKTSLELEDEIKLHETGWAIQRVGWAVILLLLVAAALGVFGNGLLSSAEISDDGNNIRFEKLVRYQSPMQLIIRTNGRENKVEVRIPQSYIESMEVDKIVPEPVDQKLASGLAIFTFKTEGPSTIKFYIIPEKTGQMKAQIQVNESNFSVTHFIYP